MAQGTGNGIEQFGVCDGIRGRRCRMSVGRADRVVQASEAGRLTHLQRNVAKQFVAKRALAIEIVDP